MKDKIKPFVFHGCLKLRDKYHLNSFMLNNRSTEVHCSVQVLNIIYESLLKMFSDSFVSYRKMKGMLEVGLLHEFIIFFKLGQCYNL